MVYDVIIIGGGAAGLTSAIYTCRKQLKTLILTVDIGGQTNLTNHIENYPGYTAKSGPELMKIFEDQAKSFGAEFVYGKAMSVKETKVDGGFEFTVKLSNGEEYVSKTLILAFGKVHRSLGIPGEEKFLGRGVSTCATCDAPLFKNKTVAVIGGGNSAVEAALELGDIATKVYLVHRRAEFRADEITVQKLKTHPKIELILDSAATEIIGDKFITSSVIENINTHEKRTLDIQGFFIEIGYMLDTDFVKDLIELKNREVVIDSNCRTSHPAIFAAGDLTTTPFKQTVISAGEGAKAALELHKYLTGGKGVSIDW